MFSPLKFQQTAIDDLTKAFLSLWKKRERQLPLVFKSPTGSGKTLMVSHFVRGLNHLPTWDEDKAFIWITFSDDIAMQSKNKFEAYFENTLENGPLTVMKINRGKLQRNDILFLNWQKVVSRAAESRIIRRPESAEYRKEQGVYFEDFIDNTRKDAREIILIIDEAHTHVTTDLAQQIVDYINPKIVLHITATPSEDIELKGRRLNAFVEVAREQVVEQGLIKEKIITQTEEDLRRFKNRDLDEVLLDLGLEKREQLKREFRNLGKDINPLLLIQLPNDDRERALAGEATKEEIVVRYLKNRGLDATRIARWFEDHAKPTGIEDNNDEHDILIFKLAAGTGWDCPRAHVLVMFRNIRVEQRYIQTIGRILRMPEPNSKYDYVNNPNLRTGFLYTNYSRSDIIDNWIDKTQNKPSVYTASRKSGITNVELQSAYVSRVDYGDLSNSAKFQASFLETMDRYFNITADDILAKAQKKLENKGVDLDGHLQNQIIVDAQYGDYDQLCFEFRKKGHDLSLEMSRNDAEKTFNYLCFQLLKEQTEDEAKITNIARSWSPLKSALRVWMKRVFGDNSDYFYRVFVKDIQKGASSVFRPALTQALKDYHPILEKIIVHRAKTYEARSTPIFSIRESYSYTDDYENLPVDANALEDFYIKKQYEGRDNETDFISYIDKKKRHIEWWFKQGIGQEYFAIKYFNTVEQKDALFYPDWVIRFKDGRTGIFDTKSGRTATDTEGRAPALARRVKELGDNFIGGILVKESGIWYYNDSEQYSYVPGKLNKDWKKFESLFSYKWKNG